LSSRHSRGEEQGLIGSSLEAVKMHKENQVIESRAHNDIQRHRRLRATAGPGNGVVNIYSDETMDSLNSSSRGM